MTKLKVNNELPLSAVENSDFRNYAMAKGIIGVQNAVAPSITTPNINAPFGALAYIKPKAIEMSPRKTSIGKIIILTLDQYVRHFSRQPVEIPAGCLPRALTLDISARLLPSS